MSGWQNFLLELGVLSFFGALYYFFQRKKILEYEHMKIPLTMQLILEACLSEKKEILQPELDELIISLDDYLKDTTKAPPFLLLKNYQDSSHCSEDLKKVIKQGFEEMGV
jgi:hypothetical protein